MNAVEIEEAVSALAEQPFDADEFPYAFLQAFGNKETTLKRLRDGVMNKSDIGGVLQTNNIHILVSNSGSVAAALAALAALGALGANSARCARNFLGILKMTLRGLRNDVCHFHHKTAGLLPT